VQITQENQYNLAKDKYNIFLISNIVQKKNQVSLQMQPIGNINIFLKCNQDPKSLKPQLGMK
jgi:hypothetical protein